MKWCRHTWLIPVGLLVALLVGEVIIVKNNSDRDFRYYGTIWALIIYMTSKTLRTVVK